MSTQSSIKRSQPLHEMDDESSSNGKMQKTHHGKSVSFNPNVRVRLTMSLDRYTQDEVEASWYSQEEYSDIRKECTKQIYMLNCGKTLRDKKYCSRGLEKFMEENAIAIADRRERAMDSVLMLQDFFDEQQQLQQDSNVIARCYREITRSSQLLAIERASKDQLVANRFLLQA